MTPFAASFALLLLPALAVGTTFWHFSDLHLDFLYSVGGNASNLCHAFAGGELKKEKDGSSVGAAGVYGCDSPPLLALSSLEAMAALQPNVSLILWTGDSAPHWRASPPDQDYIANVTSLVFTRLSELFPGVPVVPAVGNHDISPPDQWPEGGPAYASLWGPGGFSNQVPSGEKDSFLSCGFYSTVAAGLNFLVLNTNLYLRDHEVGGNDPCGQLKWLEERLVETEQRVDGKVFIVGHVPPGGQSWTSPNDTVKELHERFLRLLVRFSDVIVGQLYGHTHTDSFRLIRSEKGKPVGLSLLQGSVSPITGCNPSLRLYSCNSQKNKLVDFDQYFIDLEQIDVVPNISAVELAKRWKLLYRASESYRLKDLSPASLEGLWLKLRKKDTGLFKQYQINSVAGRQGLDCDNDCWKKSVCMAGFTNDTQIENCFATLSDGSQVRGGILESPTPALAAFLLLIVLLTAGFCWMRACAGGPGDDQDEQVLLQEQQRNLRQDLQLEPATFVVTSYGSDAESGSDINQSPPLAS